MKMITFFRTFLNIYRALDSDAENLIQQSDLDPVINILKICENAAGLVNKIISVHELKSDSHRNTLVSDRRLRTQIAFMHRNAFLLQSNSREYIASILQKTTNSFSQYLNDMVKKAESHRDVDLAKMRFERYMHLYEPSDEDMVIFFPKNTIPATTTKRDGIQDRAVEGIKKYIYISYSAFISREPVVIFGGVFFCHKPPPPHLQRPSTP
jgi:hypothetical protein